MKNTYWHYIVIWMFLHQQTLTPNIENALRITTFPSINTNRLEVFQIIVSQRLITTKN